MVGKNEKCRSRKDIFVGLAEMKIVKNWTRSVSYSVTPRPQSSNENSANSKMVYNTHIVLLIVCENEFN